MRDRGESVTQTLSIICWDVHVIFEFNKQSKAYYSEMFLKYGNVSP